ncbi:MAG: hypothetical protein QMC67_00310 [Candidatus Wallbacteria bacterium]
MSLLEKSIENLAAAKLFVSQKNYFNVTASRLYYSIFQRIIYYLKSAANFDFSKFQNNNSNKNIKKHDYLPHGSIRKAISYYLCSLKCDFKDINFLIKIDSIYKLRHSADYKDNMLKYNEIKENLEYTEKIIEILDKHCGNTVNKNE